MIDCSLELSTEIDPSLSPLSCIASRHLITARETRIVGVSLGQVLCLDPRTEPGQDGQGPALVEMAVGMLSDSSWGQGQSDRTIR